MRNITKTFNTKTANVTYMFFGKSGMETKEVSFVGCKSERAARARIKAILKHDNFVLQKCDITNDGGEQKYTMDADLFYSLAHYCEEGQTYGHDTVRVQFTVSYYDYYTKDGERHAFHIVGKTTQSKALKTIRDELKTNDVLINPEPSYVKERLYMSRDEFIQHATEC